LKKGNSFLERKWRKTQKIQDIIHSRAMPQQTTTTTNNKLLFRLGYAYLKLIVTRKVGKANRGGLLHET